MHKNKIKFRIELSKEVKKFIKKRELNFILNFNEKLKIIESDPFSDLLDSKPLKGKPKGFFRLRIGKYRFKYQIIEDEILIYFYEADSRGDIY